MVSPAAFIPGTTGRSLLPGPTLEPSQLCTRSLRVNGTRKRHAAPRIFAVQDSGESSHRTTPANGAPDADSQSTPDPEADRKALDDLTSSGESSLRDIGDAVKEELEGVSDKTQEFAENMIAEETDALLARYDERQRDLLANVDEDRRVIEGELTRISELADAVRKRGTKEDGLSLRGKSLAAVAGIFGIAAVIYAFTAVVDGDSGGFANAGIDAIVAAAAAFFFKRESDAVKGKDGE